MARLFAGARGEEVPPCLQCLDRRINDQTKLVAEIAAWEQRRNAEGAQINWMFTTQKARENLRKAYPVKES